MGECTNINVPNCLLTSVVKRETFNETEHDLTILLPLQRVPYRNVVVMMITMIPTDQNKMATNENDLPMKWYL